jgi:hypothetical protein
MTFTAWLKSWDANGGAMMLAELCAAAPAAAATTFTDDDREGVGAVTDSVDRPNGRPSRRGLTSAQSVCGSRAHNGEHRHMRSRDGLGRRSLVRP